MVYSSSKGTYSKSLGLRLAVNEWNATTIYPDGIPCITPSDLTSGQ